MKKTHGNLHPSPLPLAKEKFPAPSNAKCQHKNKLNLTTHGSYLPFFVSLSISYLDYQISWAKYGYYFHGLLYMITSQYQHLTLFSSIPWNSLSSWTYPSFSSSHSISPPIFILFPKVHPLPSSQSLQISVKIKMMVALPFTTILIINPSAHT